MLQSGCALLRNGILWRKSGPAGLEHVRSFAVVYTHAVRSQLEPFDLLILESEAFAKEEIMALRKKNKIVLSYLNVGEWETYRQYKKQIPSRWLIGKNLRWRDHFFINPGEKGWRDMLIQTIIPKLLQQGFQGFLFDSVDLASPARFPQYKDEMIGLIKSIRSAFPQIYIVLNNGDFLMDQLADHIQGLLFEEVFSQVTKENQVIIRPVLKRLAILSHLEKMKTKWRIPVFFVDYIPQETSLPLKTIRDVYKERELIPYITDVYAQKIHAEYLWHKSRQIRWQ